MASTKTPRFNSLDPAGMISVIDNFLGAKEDVDFTEKLAGSSFSATVDPSGEKSYSTKDFKDDPSAPKSGIFPNVEKVLNDLHPKVSSPVTYSFEILKKEKRPDYIDYAIDHDVAAVDLSGKLSAALAAELNAAQSEVNFLTKADIKKSVGKLIKDDETRNALTSLRDKLSAGEKVSKQEIMQVEEILMDLIDSGDVPSTLGGGRIEGLFGSVGGKGFKIPSRAYAAVQKDQARFYAIVRKGGAISKRIVDAAASGDATSDKLVSDVLDYLRRLSAGSMPKGFRSFFSPEEAASLLGEYEEKLKSGDTKAARKFASAFFGRVNDKESWLSTGELKRESLRRRMSDRLTERKDSGMTMSRLRGIIKEEASVLRTAALVRQLLKNK